MKILLILFTLLSLTIYAQPVRQNYYTTNRDPDVRPNAALTGTVPDAFYFLQTSVEDLATYNYGFATGITHIGPAFFDGENYAFTNISGLTYYGFYTPDSPETTHLVDYLPIGTFGEASLGGGLSRYSKTFTNSGSYLVTTNLFARPYAFPINWFSFDSGNPDSSGSKNYLAYIREGHLVTTLSGSLRTGEGDNNGQIEFWDSTNTLRMWIGVDGVGGDFPFATNLNGSAISHGTVGLDVGGTGTTLTDPGANRLWGWDDTDNAIKFVTIGSGLTYTHSSHTLSASGGGGGASTNTFHLDGDPTRYVTLGTNGALFGTHQDGSTGWLIGYGVTNTLGDILPGLSVAVGANTHALELTASHATITAGGNYVFDAANSGPTVVASSDNSVIVGLGRAADGSSVANTFSVVANGPSTPMIESDTTKVRLTGGTAILEVSGNNAMLNGGPLVFTKTVTGIDATQGVNTTIFTVASGNTFYCTSVQVTVALTDVVISQPAFHIASGTGDITDTIDLTGIGDGKYLNVMPKIAASTGAANDNISLIMDSPADATIYDIDVTVTGYYR